MRRCGAVGRQRRVCAVDADAACAALSSQIVKPSSCHTQERHEAGDGASAGDARGTGRSLMVVNKWRQKEKLKTTAVALVSR
jgi:hypothetical protein